MRIATYNVEWFDGLFDDEGQLLNDDGWSGRRDVTRRQQIDALAHVFRALDADAVMIIEAPDDSRTRSTIRSLETFAECFDLRARKALIGFANNTQQEIALLFDPDVVSSRHDPLDIGAPRFDSSYLIDLDVDAQQDEVVFSKPPFEVALTMGEASFHLIGAHLKSKAPHGAANPDEVMRLSIANRRKQLAQSIWLRRRIDAMLARGDDLILLGDLNDGPGLDEYEHLFGRSSVEILMGAGETQLYDPNAVYALRRKLGAQPTSSRFFIPHENRYLTALLDYVMVSRGLRQCNPRWRIWHPFEDHQCWQDPALQRALLTASDHFPVTLDLDV